jgi:hypothetical protein
MTKGPNHAPTAAHPTTAATQTVSTEQAREIADRLDRKAARARGFGLNCMVASVGVGLVIIGFFLWSSIRIDAQNVSVGAMPSLSAALGESIGTGVLRIGMVLIAVFIIQILVGFARYYFRLSEHISFSADIVRLSNGNTALIEQLSRALLPNFDFGKIPVSPIQKIVDTSMDTIKELAKKIPTK